MTFFERMEKNTASPLSLAGLFAAVIFVRIVLEYALESQKQIEPFSSFFLFVQYFAVVLCGLILLLSWFSGKSVIISSRVVAFFSFLLLFPPIVDLVASNGEGFGLSFVFSSVSITDAFLSFCKTCPGVSIGLKIEVALTLLVFGAYVLYSRKSWLWATAGLLVAYSFLLAGAFFPGFILGFFKHAYPDAYLLREVLSVYSILLSISFLFFLRSNSDIWQNVLGRIRPERSLHYAGLLLFGAMWGMPNWEHPYPGVLLPLAALVISVLFAFEASSYLNDRFDRKIDIQSNRKRANLVANALPHEMALIGSFLLISVLTGMAAGFGLGIWVLMAFFVSVLYSVPPLRMRSHVLTASLSIAVASLAIFASGFGLGNLQPEKIPQVIPTEAALLVLGMVFLASPFKDLKDAKGDRDGGVFTLASHFGPEKARLPTALLNFLAVAWVTYWSGISAIFGGIVGLSVFLAIMKIPIGQPMERIVFLLEGILLVAVLLVVT